jgi:type IX secretion system PorP/SprF family membrane protein
MKTFYIYHVPLAIILMLILVKQPILAQQKPVYSQYLYNGLVLNPAYAVVHDHLSATMSYRDQWINLEGAPTTSTFSIQSGIHNKNIGVGLMLINDKIGMHNETGVYGSYGYKIRLPHGAISMGVQGGLNNLTSDPSKLVLETAFDPSFTDYVSNTKINFGTGAYYNSKNLYVGFSIPYLRKKRIIRDGDYYRMAVDSRYYYLLTGIVLDASPKIKIKPSTLVRIEEGMPVAADLNLHFFLEEVLNLGVSYRSNESFITLFEIKLNDYFRLGYAFDWVVSDLSRYTAGTHEFSLNYRINLYAPKKDRMCPGPFYF